VYWDNLTGEDTPAGRAIAYLSVEYDEVREYLDSYDFGGDKAGDIAEPEPKPVAEVAETASVPQVMPPPRSQALPPAQQQPVPPRAMTQQPPASQPAARPPVPPQAMMQQPPASPQSGRSQVPPQAITQRPPASQQMARPRVPPQAMMQAPPARRPMPLPTTPGLEPAPVQADPSVAPPTDKPATSTRELWISAREEYHRGNIEASIRNYQQLIANTSDNYDAYGELGNVYLSRGKYREAASAYFEAASILVKQGKASRARSLLPMLDRLDRSKAEELNQLISTSSS
jgi:hypothetical protein